MKFLILMLSLLLGGGTLSAATLKVGTYNIRSAGSSGDTGWKDWSRRKSYVAQTITAYDYDIIGLNECRSGSQLSSLQEMLGSIYDFVLYNDGNTVYNPILYKKDMFTLLESGVFYLNAEDITQPLISWDNSANNRRFTAWAKLQVNETGEILYHFQTHLDHLGDDARNEQTHINMEQVRRIAGGYPAILSGDHNSTKVRVPFYNMMNSYMQDSRMTATTKVGFTSDGTLCKHTVDNRSVWDPEYQSGSRLDYIWARGVTVSEYRHIFDSFGQAEMPSDHIAIQATVTLQAEHQTLYTVQAATDNIQTVIDNAQSGDTILITAGKLKIPGTGKNATINVKKSLTIIGGWDDDFTEVCGYTEMDGANTCKHVITVAANMALELFNCDIHGGNAPMGGAAAQGGGIYAQGSRLYLENCLIHDNTAYSNGGGVYSAGALDIVNCKIYNNTSSYGGGGGAYSAVYSGELYWRFSVVGSEFYGNKGTMGSALNNGGFSWLHISGSSFHDNQASNSGTIYVSRTTWDANLTLANNLIYNNTVETTPVSGLSAKNRGGSAVIVTLNSEGSRVSMVNNTITGNSVSCTSATMPTDYYGAAVQLVSDCTFRPYNNIIAGNTSDAPTGGDLYVAEPTHVDTQHNVYSALSNMQLNPSSNDLYMPTLEEAQTALQNMLNNNLSIKSPYYGEMSINDVPADNFREDIFWGDVDNDAQFKGTLYTDYQGIIRRNDGTSTRGAYEWTPNESLKGDANTDGVVDVADITAIASYILGQTPTDFNSDNGDANSDGVVDVADITATAAIILH